MDSTSKPLTITHDILRLYDALSSQLLLNEQLREQLVEAAKMIEQLTERCVAQQKELE